MNDQAPTSGTTDLPELSQASIDRIEKAVFAEIAADRTPAPSTATASSKRRTRRRGWLTGLGVAAAFVAGILITPPLLNLTASTTAGGAGDTTAFVSDSAAGGPVDEAVPEGASMDAAGGVATEDSGREIIASAQAHVRVDDITGAVDAVAALAEEHDGYVEGTDVSATGMSADTTVPAPVPEGEYGWISIRVPAADLTTVIDELGETGTVISSSTSQQDVTATAIDLRARVDATQASVDRLTELMSQSGSVSELIDAEVALTDRQAQLESYTQQLAALEDQVAMSSLQVQLTKTTTAAPAEPAGFADGLLAGWNGLIVSLNALVVALGFLLPWLVVAGIVAVVVWLIVRRRRRDTASEVP
ncbi:DUF4349 domain-containing protein [Microbacterium abyssi]|uniref:DUF4349 domain-containing protein n=1 Tax=Microbacterium abyssi TaxID=2782166 RepID=UPI00188771F0|nr:DUF4349 domain-containing protein [Microbacterium sp. A18JL241]